MAQFLDSGTPGFVYAPDGMLIDRSALAPTDTVVGGSHAATPSPAATPLPPAGATATPLTAASLIAKRDAVLGKPTLELAGTSSTTSTQKGISSAVLDPMIAGNAARGEEQASAVKRAGEESAQRKEQAAMADSTQAFGRQQQAEAARQQAEQRAAIARQNELATSLQKDPEIDPDRYVKNMSTGTQIGTVVLAALNGAFKGMVGQSGNDVIGILGKRIDEDIAAQREQIQSGRIRRGNLVSYFQNQGLREDAAAKAAEATSWAMLDRMVAAERERIGAGQDRTQADLLAEQLKGRVAEKNDELRLMGEDRVATQNTRTMQQKQATGAGGAETFGKFLAARKAYEEAGASPKQLAAFDAHSGIPKDFSPTGESETARGKRESGEKRTEDQAKGAAALAGLTGYAQDAGLVLDPQSGNYRANPSDENMLNARQKERLGRVVPGSSRKISSAEDAAVESFGRLQSGGVISPDEADRFKDMIGSAVTDAQLAEQVNVIMRIVRPRLAAADRGGGGGIPYPEAKP